ncbi:MAG: hypothetical protein II417_00230 [Elusimicrobia bacterium]|nr:hypothetical protein [Elusimicrobiota bacterium]
MKRYAIVRVDNMCPAITEEGINICKTDKNCKNKCPYRYGDTKEQLIKKVATVLRRILKVDVCSYKYKGKMRKLETIRFKGKGRFDEIVIELEEVATKIVEFLGVEE